jgi:hypothetical protein
MILIRKIPALPDDSTGAYRAQMCMHCGKWLKTEACCEIEMRVVDHRLCRLICNKCTRELGRKIKCLFKRGRKK